MVREYVINSQKYGKQVVLLDDEDYDFVITNNIRLRLKYDKTINGFYCYSGIQALHRILTDCPKGLVVDHINRNPLDNRRCNLRVCTQQVNNNNRKVRCTNKVGVTGISFVAKYGYYTVRKQLPNGKRKYLGKAKTAEEAIKILKGGDANAL